LHNLPETEQKQAIDDFLKQNDIELTPDEWANVLISQTDPPFEHIPSALTNYLDFSKLSSVAKSKLALAAIITDNVDLLKKLNVAVSYKFRFEQDKSYRPTILELAAYINAITIVEYLLTSNKQIDQIELLKSLSYAMNANNLKIIELLLDYGIDRNYIDEYLELDYYNPTVVKLVDKYYEKHPKIETLRMHGIDIPMKPNK